MPYTPPKRRRYKGSKTNTDRWQKFASKPDDVFVCTPPKCGTTWTTTIVTMLCHGKTDVVPTELVQWIDADVVPLQEAIRKLDAQSHRRCIKSHTPFDGISWFEDAAYIAVYRHPIDMLLSLRKHLANTKNIYPSHPYLGDEDESLKHFIEQSANLDAYDDDVLETFLLHYRSYVRSPRPDNLLVLHYSDMLADARAAIESISDHMGLNSDPAFLDAVFEATKFGNMKSQPDRFAPFADRGFWNNSQAFFDSGGTNKWAGKVSAASLNLYRDRISRLLSPQEIAWLENGSVS